jgi:hypothetical protein
MFSAEYHYGLATSPRAEFSVEFCNVQKALNGIYWIHFPFLCFFSLIAEEIMIALMCSMVFSLVQIDLITQATQAGYAYQKSQISLKNYLNFFWNGVVLVSLLWWSIVSPVHPLIYFPGTSEPGQYRYQCVPKKFDQFFFTPF